VGDLAELGSDMDDVDETLHNMAVDIELKDVDAVWSYEHFRDTFLLHLVYHLAIGPFISLPMRYFEGNFFMAHNMGFGFQGLTKSVTGLFGWPSWITAIIVFCLNWKGSFTTMHEEGFDVLLMVLVLVQVLIRASTVAIKYSTFTTQEYKGLRGHHFTDAEFFAHWIIMGWLVMGREDMLVEIGKSVVR